MLRPAAEKTAYFNQYWRTRDVPSADRRSLQRAEVVCSLLGPAGKERLLDVGCGRGIVLRHLIRNGYAAAGCDLAGDTVARLKYEGCDVFLCDIEQDPLPGRYDVILCLEVLQQLFDPAAVLTKLAGALTERGYLIVSVPNEFHLWSRIQLLFGRSHLGHFDQSHIRLFNRRRAGELFERVGLAIERATAIPALPPQLKILSWLGRALASLAPNLFALSHIYRVRHR
jgi:SAM-dependent methyltransferase